MQNNTYNRKANLNPMTVNQALANERIRVPQVRLINSEGENLGVWNTREALAKARQQGLDLVAINPQAQPMVTKIVDLGKWLYDQKRAEKERLRKSRESEVQIKEIQLRPVTDEHDLQIKARNAREFLADNCKVKVVIKFRGRENAHKELGHVVMQRFLTAVGDHKQENPPSQQGNQIWALLMPVK